MAHQRDDSELRRILETHSVAGYPVVAPIFGHSVIVSQSPAVGAFIYYLVRADKPVPFKSWVESKRLKSIPWTLAEWKEEFEYGSRHLRHMQPELMDILDSGGKVSEADVEFSDLIARGCLNEDQLVTCQPFDSKLVFMDIRDVQPGMLVELVGSNVSVGAHEDVWPVRVVAKTGSELLCDLLVPTTYLRMPDALISKKIKPGFHSKSVVAFGEGLAGAWEDRGKKLPRGQWSEDKHEYLLNEPLSESTIKKFCKEFYPDEPHCLWQGLLMYVIPVETSRGSEYSARIRPLPEKSVDPEWVVPAIEE